MADAPDTGWFSEEQATFGDRLAGAREAAGLKPDDLARRLGVRLPTVQAWEDDATSPRGNRLQMLAGMLGVSIRWLLTGEGDGLDGPPPERPDVNRAARRAIAEIGRMRQQVQALERDIGRVESELQTLVEAEA